MLPEHAPFSPDLRRALDGLIASFTPAQRFWLGGYLSAGDVGAGTLPSAAPALAASAAPVKLTILYGSESGNSEKLADLSAKEAKKRGLVTTVKNMADIEPSALAKLENLLVIISTWGDGEPPETAATFYKAFMSASLDLSKLSYSVCALGDTSYEKFCQMGKDFDVRLETLGAKRVHDRVDCDVQYEKPHRTWLEGALSAFTPAQPVASAAPAFAIPTFMAVAPQYDKANPFGAELKERVLLNGKGTAKETWHYEFSLEGSGLAYEPGDALGIVPRNGPDVVEDFLKAAKLNGSEKVEVPDVGAKALSLALEENLDITALSRSVLVKLQEVTKSKKLAKLLEDGSKDKLKEYLYGRGIVDALEDFAPKGLPPETLLSILRPLPPRLYSIASSPLAHQDEVHLTVASVRYDSYGRKRKGVASTYLADLVKTEDKVPVYIQHNKNFRLPASGDTPIIMVGPGTGVAPFRAFVEHRAALEQKGKSWLFFGDQRYMFDFLYQVEWQDHLASGALTKLDVAFSRDQPEKIYVQQRMLERAKELYAWLEDGAHFYVCGDANRMAHDVNDALLHIIEKQGGKSHAAAEAYLEDLKKAKRYQRDVY
ncbi:sulfite reductase (NADPH) flavoprotein alpha-component [Prosthecobacter debontii]|uniref:assimilatory sulfite reductase (NADPH) n=1 Tax=Prosthecobacter debontii TaxID=48467 RepID=A0A1T4X9L3_9BACT|nr:assimilatory sulfite reductase (NADPH) flavoprotein subunit [Prosthecobacter debontii]SKA86294.1 sulfite reductase (NADPH) flavoprotein alpha-component [Prosthecobacter debontii]